jgi:hypothetical protein
LGEVTKSGLSAGPMLSAMNSFGQGIMPEWIP